MDSHLRRSLPLSLKVVAVIFILGGISSAIEVVVFMMRSQININFGVLGILIGMGLFKLRKGWRTCALFFTWIGLIAFPIMGLLFLNHSGPLNFSIFGQQVGFVSKESGMAMIIILFIYSIWQYRILTRTDVRLLFIDRYNTEARMKMHRVLFEKFLLLHPEFRCADSKIQWSAFHKWVNSSQRRG